MLILPSFDYFYNIFIPDVASYIFNVAYDIFYLTYFNSVLSMPPGGAR